MNIKISSLESFCLITLLILMMIVSSVNGYVTGYKNGQNDVTCIYVLQEKKTGLFHGKDGKSGNLSNARVVKKDKIKTWFFDEKNYEIVEIMIDP